MCRLNHTLLEDFVERAIRKVRSVAAFGTSISPNRKRNGYAGMVTAMPSNLPTYRKHTTYRRDDRCRGKLALRLRSLERDLGPGGIGRGQRRGIGAKPLLLLVVNIPPIGLFRPDRV